MVRLLIGNNVELDLGKDSVISLNYDLNNKDDLSAFTTVYSSSLELPLTNKNRMALGYPDIPYDSGVLLDDVFSYEGRSYQFSILDENSVLVDYGTLVIHKVENGIVSCNLFSDILSLNDRLSSFDNLSACGTIRDMVDNVRTDVDIPIRLNAEHLDDDDGVLYLDNGESGSANANSNRLVFLYPGNIGKPKDFDCTTVYDGAEWNTENEVEKELFGAPTCVIAGTNYYQYRYQQLTPVIPLKTIMNTIFNAEYVCERFNVTVSDDVHNLLINTGVVGPKFSDVDGVGFSGVDGSWAGWGTYGNLPIPVEFSNFHIGNGFAIRGLLNKLHGGRRKSSLSNLYKDDVSKTTYVVYYICTLTYTNRETQESTTLRLLIRPDISGSLDMYKSYFEYLYPYDVDLGAIESGKLANILYTVGNVVDGYYDISYGVHSCGIIVRTIAPNAGIYPVDYDITMDGVTYTNFLVDARDMNTYPSSGHLTDDDWYFDMKCGLDVFTSNVGTTMSVNQYFSIFKEPWSFLKKVFKKYNIRFRITGYTDKTDIQVVLGDKEYYDTGFKDITKYLVSDYRVESFPFESKRIVFADKAVDCDALKAWSNYNTYGLGDCNIVTPYPIESDKKWLDDGISYTCSPWKYSVIPYVKTYYSSNIILNYIAQSLDSNKDEIDISGCLVSMTKYTDPDLPIILRIAITDNINNSDHKECYFSSTYVTAHSKKIVAMALTTVRWYAVPASGTQSVRCYEDFMNGSQDVLYSTDIPSEVNLSGRGVYRIKNNVVAHFKDIIDSSKSKQLVCKVFINKMHVSIYEFVSSLYWFNNCNWVVSKVNGYVPGSDIPTEVTFVQVDNIENYLKYCDVTWSGDAHSTITATVGGSVISSPYHCIKGTTIHFSVSVDTGYHFTGWSDGNMDLERDLVVSDSVTLTSTTALNEYTVTLNWNYGKIRIGSTEYTGTTADIPVGYDGSLTFSYVPDNGYRFVRWSDGNTSNPRTLTNITADVSKTCESEIIQYTLTLISVDNVSYEVAKKVGTSWVVQSAPYVFDYGTELRVTESSTHGGYEPNGWSDDVMDNPRYLILNSNVSLKGRLKVRYFTVSCTANNCTVTGTGSKAYGSVVTLVATPSVQYKIESDPWTNKPTGATVSADYKTLTFTMPASNVTTVTCTAQPQVYNFGWSGVNQTIAVKVNGSTVTDNPHTCTYPSTVQVTSTPVPTGGYTFTQWNVLSGSTVVGRSTANPYSFSIERATSVVGIVTAVNYNTVSGTLTHATISSGLGSHAYGSTVRITASADTYYELYNGAWSLTCGSSSVTISSHASDWSWIEFVQPVGNVTVNITTRRYTYSFKMSVTAGTGTITGSYTYEGTTYNLVDGTTYQVPAGISIAMVANPSSAAHYVFNKWSDGETNRSRTVQVTSSITYYASFKLEQYQVTFSKYATYDTTTVSATAGGVAISSGAYVDYGKKVIITCNPLPSDKYSFVSWKSGSTVVSTNATYTINSLSSAVNVVAYLGVKTYALTVSGVNCTVSGAGTYEYGTTVVVSATPNSHYHWGSWSDGGAQTHSVTITGAKTLTATCAIDQHTLTLVGNHCTVTGGGTYNYGTVVTVNVSAIDSHYHWGQWSDGGARQHTVTVDSTKTLTATAVIDTHTLTLTGVNCTVSGGGTYNYGTSVNVSCTPSSHYHFGSWSDGGAQTHAVTVDSNKSLTCTCVVDTYTVGCTVSNCTVTGTGTYNYGSTVTLTATPSTHYHLASNTWSSVPSGWTVSSDYKSVTGTVTGNVTLVAHAFIDTSVVTAQTYVDGSLASFVSYISFTSGTSAGSGTNYIARNIAYGNTASMTANTSVSGYTFLGWYNSSDVQLTTDATYNATNVTSSATYRAKWVTAQSVTFSSGSYMQVGTRKRFGFVISGSTSSLYSQSIDIEVMRRRTGVAEETIATGSVTLSSTGTYTQLPSATFQATDSYIDATYYIYAYKDGTFLGSVQCEEQVSNTAASEEDE